MGYIYKITNTINGKCYIGQTIRKLETRISGHFSKSSCRPLRNAIQKYGRDAFTVEILHETLDIFLDDLEVLEIKRHNSLAPNGYNVDSGGHINKVFSEQTRKKMSDAQKGKTPTLETRKKMSEAQKQRKPISPETRKKLSDAAKGRTHTPEARKKMSESRKGRTLSPEHRKKLKGRTLSSEHRKKISDANKGKTPTLETRKKMSDAAKSRTYTLETRQKMSESRKGRKGKPQSPEHYRKLSEANAYPERAAAVEILNSLPERMPLTEKRRILFNKFPGIHKGSIYRWVKKWSKTPSN